MRGLDEPPSAECLALLDQAACALFRTTTDGTFLRVNRTFCKWVGHPPEALIRKRRLQDLLTMGARIFHQTHWAPLLQMQGSLSEVKLEVLHRDGSSIPMVLNALVLEQGGVKVHEVAGYVARDRDKYERELVLSRRRLEKAVDESTRLEQEAKDRAVLAEQMIGIVSHDLKNPLSTIQMGAVLLSRGDLNQGQQRTLSRINRAVESAKRLISDLLDFTQARLGRAISVSPAAFDLHAAVAETVDDLALAHPNRPLKHERIGDGVCIADANRLGQAIGNLVANAVAYGRADTPVTVVSAIEASSFSVSVHNLGEPIPPELRPLIFQPLTRGTRQAEASRSIGLGLYIVSEIAKAQGGHAEVVSTAEAGTTFKLVFPRRSSVTLLAGPG
ncbi:MAG TPA: PAS domain-containing sensor histidine kinase [Polyangia bacterium]